MQEKTQQNYYPHWDSYKFATHKKNNKYNTIRTQNDKVGYAEYEIISDELIEIKKTNKIDSEIQDIEKEVEKDNLKKAFSYYEAKLNKYDSYFTKIHPHYSEQFQDKQKELIQLKNQLARTKKDYLRSLISREVYNSEYNKIIYRILLDITELKNSINEFNSQLLPKLYKLNKKFERNELIEFVVDLNFMELPDEYIQNFKNYLRYILNIPKEKKITLIGIRNGSVIITFEIESKYTAEIFTLFKNGKFNKLDVIKIHKFTSITNVTIAEKQVRKNEKAIHLIDPEISLSKRTKSNTKDLAYTVIFLLIILISFLITLNIT